MPITTSFSFSISAIKSLNERYSYIDSSLNYSSVGSSGALTSVGSSR
jgi:hypothetical protein